MRKLLFLIYLLLSLNVRSADYCRVVKFVLEKEGGFFKDENTYKGIMYEPTWVQYFGKTYDRFLRMDDGDWAYIFARGYWEPIRGDEINDLKVAESIADWSFNAGITLTAKKVDKILGLPQDGKFDDATIKAINEAKPSWLWAEINKERVKFYVSLGWSNPSKYRKFVDGWNSRVISLIIFQHYAPENICY